MRTDPCHFIDILPTFVELAGGNVNAVQPAGPPLPGISLGEAIRSGQRTKRDFIYFNHSNNRALRKDDWKIVAKGLDGPWELYDMKHDRCEQKNLADAKPELLKAMASEWTSQDDLYAKQRETSAPSKAKRMPESKSA
jgi:arylsulfatase